MTSCIRWGDNDRYWGPFTYARDDCGWRPFAIVLELGSGDSDFRKRLRMSALGHTLIVAIPGLVKHTRDYGFSCSEGFLQVFYGPQTMDSSTTKSLGYFLPWTQWRHVRHSMYDGNGEHFWTAPRNLDWKFGRYEAIKEAEDTCPSLSFEFDDFDGERIVAKTRIEEREWLFGEGWFKWLSWFRKPKVVRSLDISFSSEVGKRKGSWKGGTLGHGITMLPGELHEAAFRRYCAENNMTFVGIHDADTNKA
jgi:hypothetical protein